MNIVIGWKEIHDKNMYSTLYIKMESHDARFLE